MYRINALYILILLSIYSLQIHAANVTYRAGVSFGKYNNVNLVAQPVEGELSQSLNLGLRVFEDSASILANVDVNFSTFDYKKDIAVDRNFGQLLANFVWRIQPGRFEWVFDNNFTQSVINPLQSNAPANRQNINVLSTGPNYIIRLNPRNNIQMEARAENYTYQQSPNNNRLFTAIRWLHNVNTALTMSLNNESELARYQENVGNLGDFKRNDIFMGVNYARGQNIVAAEYGVSSIKNENIPDISSDRYLLTLTNSRTRTSSIQFRYENYLSNTGNQVLRLDSNAGNGGGAPIDSVTNDVFVNEGFRLQYNKTITNGAFVLNGTVNTRRYERFTNLDIDTTGFNANLLWYIQRNSNFIIDIRGLETDYINSNPNRIDSDKIYSAEYQYRIKRNFNVSLLVSALERISTIEDRSYEDIRIFISLNYFLI